MRIPSVHLNGTNKGELLRQQKKAILGLDNALKCLVDAAPNARDYYPQGEGAYEEAEREYRARVQALVGVLEDYRTIFRRIGE